MTNQKPVVRKIITSTSSPSFCTMVFGVTMTMAMTALLILPIPNHAFAPARPRSLVVSPMKTACISDSMGRKFALSARDTIFSFDDDDDDEKVDDDDKKYTESVVESVVGSGDDKDKVKFAEMISNMAEEIDIESTISTGTDTTNTEEKKKKTGDPLREDNGVRPSIHPTTINAITEALKARAAQSMKIKKNSSDNQNDDDDDDMMHFRVSETVDPIKVMVTAGQFASDAIQKRQESSEDDGMLLNQGEEQTLAGRVMGVIMRFDTLEEELAERASSVEWIAQYDEWGSFGVLEDEHKNNEERADDDDDDGLEKVHAKIVEDPLFCMNRAECLLGIFLQEVELPQLKRLNETVPDESKIDFLDEDRLEVIIMASSE